MDSNVAVALIGMGGIFITACSVVLVAVVNSRKERGDTAENAVESTLRERLTLRDEQIAALMEDKSELKVDLAAADAENDAKDETIATQGMLIAEQIEKIAEQAKIIADITETA